MVWVGSWILRELAIWLILSLVIFDWFLSIIYSRKKVVVKVWVKALVINSLPLSLSKKYKLNARNNWSTCLFNSFRTILPTQPEKRLPLHPAGAQPIRQIGLHWPSNRQKDQPGVAGWPWGQCYGWGFQLLGQLRPGLSAAPGEIHLPLRTLSQLKRGVMVGTDAQEDICETRNEGSFKSEHRDNTWWEREINLSRDSWESAAVAWFGWEGQGGTDRLQLSRQRLSAVDQNRRRGGHRGTISIGDLQWTLGWNKELNSKINPSQTEGKRQSCLVPQPRPRKQLWEKIKVTLQPTAPCSVNSIPFYRQLEYFVTFIGERRGQQCSCPS